MAKSFKRFRFSFCVLFAIASVQFWTRSRFARAVLEDSRARKIAYQGGRARVPGGNPVEIPEDFSPLLDQPYYIYEELLWLDGGYQRSANVASLLQEADYLTQYSEDLWFSLAALKHPMRTMDPAKAKLFVVPLLTHLVVNPVPRSFCWGGLCNYELLEYADGFLQQSLWFQKHGGADHILVGTHPDAARLSAYDSLRKCHAIALENQKWNYPERFVLPSLRWANSCDAGSHVSNKTIDIVAVGDNATIEELSWASSAHSKMILAMANCDELIQGRFGLYMRDDSSLWGHAHVLSMLQSYVVPIFTSEVQYKALPDWIDWESLSYFVNVSQDTGHFKSSISAILADEEVYRQKLKTLIQNHDLFNWRTIVPFDTYMHVLLAKLESKERTKDPAYSALRIPVAASHTFNFSSKETWCGGSGYHSSCGACPMDFGAFPSAGCGGNCHWCQYGIVSNPLASSTNVDSSRCFEHSQACHEPDIATIVNDLAQPARAWEGEPLGFCFDGNCTGEGCTKGILLAKTFKTASTTAAAVSIHLAERVARRKGLKSKRCQYAVHHKFSRYNFPRLRDEQSSVLWSSVRDPGPRALSAYYFYRAGHKKVVSTDEKTIKFLNLVKNHQFVQLRTDRGVSADGCCQTSHQIMEDSNQLFARVLREEIIPLYDFVAVTERMDESLVALKMLWGLETGDIVVSAAKAGEYSYNWNPKGTCFKIPRTVKTKGVLEYIGTDFHRGNADFVLHAVYNRSLDLTIEKLGRDNFNREMKKYERLKAIATEFCRNNATFPCSEKGEWQSGYVESCYEYDVGCGYRCIDGVLNKYEMGELSLD